MVAGQDTPHPAQAEIHQILERLGHAWPHLRTLNYGEDRSDAGFHGKIEHYIVAVEWLTDRGLMTFEALMIDARGVSIFDSALTQKGHEYYRMHWPAEFTDRPETPPIDPRPPAEL